MKIVGDGDIRPLSVNAEEALRLGLVSLIFLNFAEGNDVPCGPSHYFCEAAANAPADAYTDILGYGPKKIRKSREVFLLNAAPCSDELGVGSWEVQEWVNAALALGSILTDETVAVVYELGLALGGKPRLDG